MQKKDKAETILALLQTCKQVEAIGLQWSIKDTDYVWQANIERAREIAHSAKTEDVFFGQLIMAVKDDIETAFREIMRLI